jgi:hypothetical protein
VSVLSFLTYLVANELFSIPQCHQTPEPFALAAPKKESTRTNATNVPASAVVKKFALATPISVTEPPQSKPPSVFF